MSKVIHSEKKHSDDDAILFNVHSHGFKTIKIKLCFIQHFSAFGAVKIILKVTLKVSYLLL